jgi:hypothetical protein
MDERMFTAEGKPPEGRVYLYWMTGMNAPARFTKSFRLSRKEYTAQEYLFLHSFCNGTMKVISFVTFAEHMMERVETGEVTIGERWPESLTDYQEQQERSARHWQEAMVASMHRVLLRLDTID